MTPTWDCADARLALGVYVLGAIDPAERALVDAHLATCRDCRDELAGLAGLPALLARVNPDEISQIGTEDIGIGDTVSAVTDHEPPAELIGTVLDLAQARWRRNRWGFLAAAAAVVAIAGGLFAGLNSANTRTVPVPSASGHWETVQAANSVTGTTASIAYGERSWGYTFDVLTDHIATGTTCQLWVVHPDGTRTQVAAWTTAYDEGKTWYPGSMAATAKPIKSFEITANHKVLLAATPT